MNREFLKELGLEEDAIDKVMAAHGKTIQDLKPAKDELESVQSEKAKLEEQLQSLQQTLSSKDEELKSIDDLKKQIKSYELNELKTNVAIKAGLPLELAGRLSGETEDEIKADAEKIAGYVQQQQPTPPLRPTEPELKSQTQEMEQMLDELTGKQ